MTFLVFGFVVAAILAVVVCVEAMRRAWHVSPAERAILERLTATDLAEIARLTAELAPAREDLTGEVAVYQPAPVSHRSNLTARTPLSYRPRHLCGPRWSAPVINPDEEFNVLIAAEFGTVRELVAA